VISSKDIKGSLILTNQRLMIGGSRNSIYLKDIKTIDIPSINAINITLEDREVKLFFEKRSIGHAVDQFASILLGGPYEAGSWQEEVSSYTSYWASLLTIARFLYGQVIETVIEEVPEERRAWCARCQMYVLVPWTDIPVWEINCPECGRKGMTTLSPTDRL